MLQTLEPTVDPGLRVLQSLRKILRRVSAHSRAVGRESGLSVPQILCLRAIAEADADEVTVALVADVVHLSRSTVSVLVDRMVREGLVNRDRSERDRRRVHLSLTERGRTRLAEGPQPLEESFISRLASLDVAEREAILRALEKVVALMDAEDYAAEPLLVVEADLT